MKWYWITLIILGVLIVIGTIVIIPQVKPGELPFTLPDKFAMPYPGGIPGLGTTSYSKKNGVYWQHFSGSSFGGITQAPQNKQITKNAYKQAYQNYLKAKTAAEAGILPS